MKKLFATLLAMLMVLSLAGCAKNEEQVADNNTEEVTEPADATGVYTVYNMTGAKLTELYLYEAGSADKGTNYAADGIKNTKKVELTYNGKEDTPLVLEFNYEGGETQTYETLHIETAPVTLKSVDAAAGASVIAFEVPKGTGKYTVTNATGADVTELYMYPTGAEDKGENYAEGGLADGASVEIVYEGEYGVDYILEFANADSEARNYPTLHIEEAPIKLLSVDEAAGASNISFKG